MPSITPTKLSQLRAEHHKTQVYATFLRANTIWSGRINDISIERGETSITFDAGITGDVSYMAAGQELWIGTATARFDVGRIRIRSFSSGDGGVTGTITVPKHSFVLSDNLYLAIKHNYPPFPAYPLLGDDGTFYKDGEDEYTDENEEPPPVVIAGPHRVGIYDADLSQCVFSVDASESYAIADGATIASYAVSVTPGNGVSDTFNTATGKGNITVTSSTLSYYWVKFTVTDSNGKSQSSYRCFMVQLLGENESAEGLKPIGDINVNQITGEWDRGGWYAQVTAVGNDIYNYLSEGATPSTGLASIPDLTLCIIWQVCEYGQVTTEIGYDQYANILLVGYTQNDYLETDWKTGQARLTLNVVTIEELLKNNFMFSISLAAGQGTPTTWYEYESWLTVGRVVHHVLKWHSTVMEICDVVGLLDNTDPRPYGDLESGTLYSIVDGVTLQHGIRAKLVSSKDGRLNLTPDLQLLTDDERDAIDTIFEIEHTDLGDSFALLRNRSLRVAYVFASGISWDGTSWDDDGVPEIGAYCSVAPGRTPAYGGGGTVNLDRQTIRSQEHCNELAGRVLAKENALYPEVRMTFHGNYSGVFDIHFPYWYSFSIEYGDTARRIAEPDLRLICRQVVLIPDSKAGTLETSVVFEPESLGQTGEAGICMDDLPDTGGDPDPIPTSSTALVTSSSIYVRLGDDSSWENRSTVNSTDMVIDPYWQTTQGSSYANDAILIKCGYGYVRKTLDLWVNILDISPITNPPNDSNDSPAPTPTELNYVYLSNNDATIGSFAVAATWQNSSNEWRSWVATTSNYGASWTWRAIT